MRLREIEVGKEYAYRCAGHVARGLVRKVGVSMEVSYATRRGGFHASRPIFVLMEDGEAVTAQAVLKPWDEYAAEKAVADRETQRRLDARGAELAPRLRALLDENPSLEDLPETSIDALTTALVRIGR